MGDMGDDFRAWGEMKKAKKEANKVSSTDLLTENGIEFEVKNGGSHLIVNHNDKIIDFWPSTGKWTIRPSGSCRRGIFRLIKELNK